MLFLIPVAVIGYQMYEKKQKEKNAAELEEGRQEDGAQQKAAGQDDSESGGESTVEGDCDMAMIFVEKQRRLLAAPEANINKVENSEPSKKEQAKWLKDVCKSLQNHSNPFVVRSNREALTYEIMGNQGSNALPFPKISYH